MKKLLLILRSRRGDLLVDGMVGAAVVGVIIAVTAGMLVVLGQTSVNNTNNAARTILLNTVLNDKLPGAAALTATPAVSTQKVMDSSVDVAIWREQETKSGTPTGTSVLYARTARYGNTNPAQCLTADKTNPGGCLITMIRRSDAVSGVMLNKFPLIPGTGGVRFRTAQPIPATAKEVRYVFKVTQVDKTSTMTFTGDAGGPGFTVNIPAGQTGFYYGSVVMPTTASNLYLTPASTGTLTFDDTSFLLYGAPQ